MAHRRSAFTILEILISLGLIALLVSLVVISMKGVRASASRAESLNALRNMMRAYSTYSTDHRQKLLPGYLDEDGLAALGITAKLASGFNLMTDASNPCDGNGRCDASSYVWRLAPYLDHNWKLYFTDYRSKALISQLDEEFGQEQYGPGSVGATELGISACPSFGLNSIFVGGDNFHGDAPLINQNPFFPADPDIVIAATSASQVRNPGRLTVFGAAMAAEQPTNPPVPDLVFGNPELRPPFTAIDAATGLGVASTRQWEIGPEGTIVETDPAAFNNGGGWPIGRWGEDKVPLGKFDGSVEVVDRYELSRDMSRWSPFATGLLR